MKAGGKTMGKRALSRRTMLRGILGGAAVAMALPPLEAMLNPHGTAFANGSPLPKRFMTWFIGNGIILDRFTPSAQGSAYELTEELAPLANVKEYCSVLSGFDNKAGYGRRGHHDGVAGCFSGHPFIEIDPGNANYASKFGGPSIDQVAASVVGSNTFLPSLEVGVSRRVVKGEGPTLQYLSHKGPNEPLAAEYSPKAVFQKLFGSYTPEDDPSGPLRVGLLDAVRGDAERLKKAVGKSDQLRLDAHLQSISQLQKQIQALPPVCAAPAEPTGENQAVDGHEPLEETSKLMADLVTVAWACDITRVVSFMQSGSVGSTLYYMVGATDGHHELSHEPGGQEIIHKTVVFNMGCFAYLLERLAATPEGDGNLLDNSCILFGSDCSEGITHSTFDQPIVIAGRGGGALKYPGVHYRSSSDENTTDVLLSCLQTLDPSVAEAGSAEGYSNTPCDALKA
jgi:hypothetical protein